MESVKFKEPEKFQDTCDKFSGVKITTEKSIETVKTTTCISPEYIKEILMEMMGEIVNLKKEMNKRDQIIRVIRIRDEDYKNSKEQILNLVKKKPHGITTLEIAEKIRVKVSRQHVLGSPGGAADACKSEGG